MADDFNMQVEGLDGLQDAVEHVKDAAGKALRKALRASGTILQQAAEERVARDTGFLAEHIQVTTRVDNAGMTASVGVKAEEYPDQGKRKWKRTAADVARFTEYGTEHESAHPFMRPSFDENVDNMVQEFFTTLNEEMEKIK